MMLKESIGGKEQGKEIEGQAPISFSELTCHAGQVVDKFYLPDIILDLPEISYNIC